MNGEGQAHGRSHALWMGILLVAFLIRVGIQLLQSIAPTAALPPFDAWQSGTIPYWSLLVSQGVIIALALWAIFGFARGTTKRNVMLGRIITWAGVVYFVGAVDNDPQKYGRSLADRHGHDWLDPRRSDSSNRAATSGQICGCKH